MAGRKSFSCSQCGGPDLERSGEGKLRCSYCGCLYCYSVRGPAVVIRKGASVVFGRNARVVIRGGLEIEDEADVRMDGEITLLERAPEEDVTAARLLLLERERADGES